MSKIHQINEEHLGTDATREHAEKMAAMLTESGYATEYTSVSGATSSVTDDDGNSVEIPDAIWFDCLRKI